MVSSKQSLRGIILKFLGEVYPHMALEIDLLDMFHEDWTVKTIQQALQYLVDKGYVERIDKPLRFLQFEKKIFYKLTPKGVDLLEGVVEDPGVLVERQ